MNERERQKYMAKWYKNLSEAEKEKRNERTRIYRQKPNVKKHDREMKKKWTEKNRNKVNASQRKYHKRWTREQKDEDNKRKLKIYHSMNKKDRLIWNKSKRLLSLVRRLELIEKLGGKCKDCGINDYIVLQIGHKKDDGAKDRRRFITPSGSTSTVKMVSYYLKKPKEAKKRLKVQCANCNWRQRMKGVGL